MNHCTSKSELPQNIEPTVQDRQLRIDNLFAQMWAALGLNGHLGRAGMTKRSGLERTRNSVSAADVALAARLFDRHVLSSLHAGIFSSAQRCGV